jgi:hypothetical protein
VAEVTGTGGAFWAADNPSVRVAGELIIEVGKGALARLTNNLRPDPRVTLFNEPDGRISGFAVSGLPEGAVESFQPITLHGQLDNGESVTLLDAQNHGAAGGFAPRYRSPIAVLGAWVSDDQLYNAVRFRMDRPYWLAHLTDGQSSEVEDDGSTLTVDASDGDNWLVYESSSPANLRQLEMRVTTGCLALLQLALHPDDDRAIREMQIRIEPGDPWLSVHGAGICMELGSPEHQPLLTPDQLSIKHYTNWIALHTMLDGLTWVVARPFIGDVQTRVLLLTTIIEGFHRAMPGYEKRKFPGVDKPVLRQILEAARSAAVTQAAIEGLDQDPVENAVTFYTEVSYQDRAEAIVAEVSCVIPEITESISEFPRRIKTARNDLAHHLTREAKKPIVARALEWLVVSNGLSWLLRALLLLRAGIEPQVLHERFCAFQQFGFFRANTAQHVGELGWELPAAPAVRVSSMDSRRYQ